jgi:hypothetical protein
MWRCGMGLVSQRHDGGRRWVAAVVFGGRDGSGRHRGGRRASGRGLVAGPCSSSEEEGSGVGPRWCVEGGALPGQGASPQQGSLLTRKVHSTPNTQQAEQSWLHTRRERKTCQSIFSEN